MIGPSQECERGRNVAFILNIALTCVTWHNREYNMTCHYTLQLVLVKKLGGLTVQEAIDFI